MNYSYNTAYMFLRISLILLKSSYTLQTGQGSVSL